MTIAGYLDFLEEYCAFYDEIALMQQEKWNIVSENALHLLDDFVKREQVFMLKARGMEEKRVKLQAQIGMPDLTMQEIVETLAGEQQQRLRELRIRLTNSVDLVKAKNQICTDLVNDRLGTIEQKIKGLRDVDQKKADSNHLMNRSV